MPEFVLERIETYVFRAPIEVPVPTAFGVMTDRPAVLVRVQGRDGAYGWGEVWGNFPGVGAEHRARLIADIFAPLELGRAFAHPAEPYVCARDATRLLALQCGEPGPFAQALAGLDIACWDMAARRAGEPLWRFLGAERRSPIRAYASGIHPSAALAVARDACARGFRAFKLKLGFDTERDLRALAALRDEFQELPIMTDVNQGWTLDVARSMMPRLDAFDLTWLEEPLSADRPLDEWRELAQAGATPLAAGENLRGTQAFEALLDSGAVGVVQPDVGKWGGFTECLPLARKVRDAGRMMCPHFLGGGVGFVASLHLLVASGADGFAEYDTNPNPLREVLGAPFPPLANGLLHLNDAPGLGVEPDFKRAQRYVVAHQEITA